MAKEGYFMVDNRLAPPTEGLPRFLETSTRTCGHCQQIVIMNPGRVRQRTFCKKCDHYVCDNCAAVMWQTGECQDIQRTIDKVLERSQHG